MKELLEAGVHFGHQTKRWNPKMKQYIFGERNGIYIIDLQKTLKLFKEATQFVAELTAQGKIILFVGTKRQAQDAIAEEAKRCGMYFVNQRWLGGLLTNFSTIQKSIKRLRELDEMATDGRYELLPKKEVTRLERERIALEKNLSGIKTMPRLPDAIFIIDSKNEEIAVAEARRLGIPVSEGRLVLTPQEARAAAEELGGGPVVVKAQVLMGGRGKAGGVKLFSNAGEAGAFAKELIGKKLVSIQNPAGMIVEKVLIADIVDIAKEFTDLLTFERSYQANSRVITTSDQILQETVNLIRG